MHGGKGMKKKKEGEKKRKKRADVERYREILRTTATNRGGGIFSSCACTNVMRGENLGLRGKILGLNRRGGGEKKVLLGC